MVKSKIPKHLILIIKDTELVLCLVHADILFGFDVTFHGMMSVKMIRGNIKHSTDQRLKLMDCLKLKTADLCYSI